MKKVVRYVTKYLDAENRMLLGQYLRALHGRLEHEWVAGETKVSDIAFVQTRQQLDLLPEGAKAVAFMPRPGSTVSQAAPVIDRPHLVQTFARNLNRSADEALISQPSKHKLGPRPSLLQVQGGPEFRKPLQPLGDTALPTYNSLAEALEHAKRARFGCYTIAAPEGWRLFVNTASNCAYARGPGNRSFGASARFLTDLRGVFQITDVSPLSLQDEVKDLTAIDFKRLAWDVGMCDNQRLLPWFPTQGQLNIKASNFPEGLALNKTQNDLLQMLSRPGNTLVGVMANPTAPRHAVCGMLNAMEMAGALSITELRGVAAAATAAGMMRRDALAH
jgi:hypothetical protein